MIQRKCDELGRIVIPQEMRQKLKITHKTLLDIDLSGNKIVISKSKNSCLICGSSKDVDEEEGICKECIDRIKKL